MAVNILLQNLTIAKQLNAWKAVIDRKENKIMFTDRDENVIAVYDIAQDENGMDAIKRITRMLINNDNDKANNESENANKEDKENKDSSDNNDVEVESEIIEKVAKHVKTTNVPFIFARSLIFLPFDRLSDNNPVYRQFRENKNVLDLETAWYKLQIRNRLLTMKHLRALLAAIMVANNVVVLKTNEIAIKFSIYQVAKKMGIIKNWRQYGKKVRSHVIDIFNEIADMRFVIKDKKEEKQGSFRIIDEPFVEGDTYAIKFTKTFTKLLADEYFFKINDIKLNMDGIVLKLILFMQTQAKNKTFSMTIRKFLEMQKADYDRKIVHKYTKKIKNSRDLLAAYNIILDEKNETIIYNPNILPFKSN